MKYRCDKNHFISTTFRDFNSGYRCMKCCGSEKHTYKYVKKCFEDNGYELLETEYTNGKTKMKYRCDKNHLNSTPFHSFHSGKRCPDCVNKTEAIVNDFLEKNYTCIVSQPKFEWCKNEKHLPFDFLLEELDLIIEVDGAQHFRQVRNWKSPIETLERDILKMNLALEQNYSVIRIFQEDIWDNTINWKELLQMNIKKYEEPTIIYISNDPRLYDNHKIKNEFKK